MFKTQKMYSVFTLKNIFKNVFDVVEYDYTCVYARYAKLVLFTWLHHLTVSDLLKYNIFTNPKPLHLHQCICSHPEHHNS